MFEKIFNHYFGKVVNPDGSFRWGKVIKYAFVLFILWLLWKFFTKGLWKMIAYAILFLVVLAVLFANGHDVLGVAAASNAGVMF